MVVDEDIAPGFELRADDGSLVQLSSLLESYLILYFYPRDDTPGCTAEACAFRDSYGELMKSGAVIVGVSPDSVESHRGFRDRHSLPFRLLSDEALEVARAYGAVKGDAGGPPKGIRRTTFLIRPDGTVRKRLDDVDPALHVGELLEILDREAI